jgi:hypothetical protein
MFNPIVKRREATMVKASRKPPCMEEEGRGGKRERDRRAVSAARVIGYA